jgi:ADP-heptose:LPS heptosyltransferase
LSHRSPRLEASSLRKVAVFRALKIGDMLCAVPALRALRAALPNAELVLVGLPWAREFAARFAHLLDGFREFPGWPGLPEQVPQLERIPDFLAQMQAERFDLAVQLHGSGVIANPLVALFAAKQTAGFYPAGGYCPDAELFRPWPDDGLEVRRLLALTEFLGVPSRGEHLEFPLTDADHRAAAQAAELEPGGYVCVHPGASVPERRWPPESFAEVADALAARGYRVVLTGTAGEAHLTRAVADAMTAPALDLTGRTDLGATAALIASARLLVCNDTGVSHVAAAARTPSVVASFGDNPARWAPPDPRLHRVLCRPTGAVPTADVLAEVRDLLDTNAFTDAAPRTPHHEGSPCAPSAC